MVKYEFKAKDAQGRTRTGVIRAESLNEFYIKLKEQNLLCISVKETSSSSDINISLHDSNARKKLKIAEISIFCRQFATMMSSGLTVVKCLDILYRQAEKKYFKKILLELYENIKKGNSLSAAMKGQGKTFPKLLVSMIESGEASGKLDEVMLKMSTHYEQEKILKGKLKTAMIYPIVLGITTVGVIIVLLTAVLPQIFSVFGSNDNLPGSTKFLLAISDFLVKYWYIAIALVVGGTAGGFVLLKIESVRLAFDKLKLKMPVFGKLMMIVCTSRFSGTVAALYSSGVSIIEAIRIASNVLGNAYLSKELDTVIKTIKQGETFSKAIIDRNVFPAMFSSMVYIGEESGALDEILEKTSDYYNEESQQAITKMVALLEPCMLVIMGLVIGFIVVSIAQPMFGMYDMIA